MGHFKAFINEAVKTTEIINEAHVHETGYHIVAHVKPGHQASYGGHKKVVLAGPYTHKYDAESDNKEYFDSDPHFTATTVHHSKHLKDVTHYLNVKKSSVHEAYGEYDSKKNIYDNKKSYDKIDNFHHWKKLVKHHHGEKAQFHIQGMRAHASVMGSTVGEWDAGRKVGTVLSTQREETIHEAEEHNHRVLASKHGLVHPEAAAHMKLGKEHDFYSRENGDKLYGKVIHKTATAVHLITAHPEKGTFTGKVHKFKIGRAQKVDEAVNEVYDNKRSMDKITSFHHWKGLVKHHHGEHAQVVVGHMKATAVRGGTTVGEWDAAKKVGTVLSTNSSPYMKEEVLDEKRVGLSPGAVKKREEEGKEVHHVMDKKGNTLSSHGSLEGARKHAKPGHSIGSSGVDTRGWDPGRERAQTHSGWTGIEEVETTATVVESLPDSANAGDFIHDFVHSKNKKFKGDSTKQRIKRALGAYYSKNEAFAFPSIKTKIRKDKNGHHLFIETDKDGEHEVSLHKSHEAATAAAKKEVKTHLAKHGIYKEEVVNEGNVPKVHGFKEFKTAAEDWAHTNSTHGKPEYQKRSVPSSTGMLHQTLSIAHGHQGAYHIGVFNHAGRHGSEAGHGFHHGRNQPLGPNEEVINELSPTTHYNYLKKAQAAEYKSGKEGDTDTLKKRQKGISNVAKRMFGKAYTDNEIKNGNAS